MILIARPRILSLLGTRLQLQWGGGEGRCIAARFVYVPLPPTSGE